MHTNNIDCHKCGCSNKLGTIYCRNCGTKLKFDKKMLDTHKGKDVQKAVKRAFKVVIVLIIIGVIGIMFCPWGFPAVTTITDKDEVSAVVNTCKEIDKMLTRPQGSGNYEFTPAEATLVANYLTLQHERPKTAAKVAFTGVGKMGSASDLQGVGKMGDSKGLGGTGKMEFESKEEAKPAYVDPENARLRAWMKRKQEDAKNAGKPVLSPSFDFVITVKDDKTLSIVLKEKWLKFIPARLEICVEPTLEINAKEKTQVMKYKISSARLGHLPIPLYFEEYIISLFEEMLMQERAWAKQYFLSIKQVEIVNDNINVIIGK